MCTNLIYTYSATVALIKYHERKTKKSEVKIYSELMLTSSRADEWLETSKFRGENVVCEFPSRSPAIPCRALIVEPNMFLSFPNLPHSSSVAFKIKPNNEVIYRLTIQSQECMQRESSSYLDLTSAIVDTKDCMSSSIYFNCCSCCVTANATMLCKTSRC